MKRLKFFSMMLLAAAVAFTSCKDDDSDDPTPGGGGLVEDGMYIVGDATPYADVNTDGFDATRMAIAYNEVLQAACESNDDKISSACQRSGMYEKYIYLEGGKSFTITQKSGSSLIEYGAVLTTETLSGTDEPAIEVYKGTLTENTTLQVDATGLYHIIVDLNIDNKPIIIAPAEMGVRGAMNSWGFTALNSTIENGVITYELEDQSMAQNGEFKFAYGGGWKMIIDSVGGVNVNTNLGLDCYPGANNISVDTAGMYTIKLTYQLKADDIKNCFSYETTLTEASSLPTEMYMIGTDFGNWDWASDGVVSLIPVNGQGGQFWCIRYISSANGFKFCTKKEWNGDFTELGTDDGYTVSSGNCFVESDGIYMIHIDYANSKVHIEPAAVYGIGPAFGDDWTEGVESHLFSANGQTLVGTALNEGSLRMYAASSIATSDWWTREFVIINGEIVYRADGGELEAVAVSANQTITLNFNTGTGSIE